MLFINAIRRMPTWQSAALTLRQPALKPTEEQGLAAMAEGALSVAAPRRSPPHLAARWEVDGLFPDSTGRPIARLRCCWRVEGVGTPESEGIQAQGVTGYRSRETNVARDARAS
jgi:hypothetical protein